MNYIKLITIGFLALFLLSGCAQTHYDKGMHAYEQMAYKKATRHFEKYLSKKKEDQNSRIFLAKAYLKMNAFDEAESSYARAFEQTETPLSPINKLEYAQVLAINNKKEEAKKWAKDYLRDVPDDIQAEDFIKGLDQIKKEEIEIQLISNEGFTASFAVVPSGQALYFVGEPKRKTTEKANPWNGESFLDIYCADLSTEAKISSPKAVTALNSKLHDGPFCFNATADKIWISRSAVNEKAKALSDESNLNQIYIYQLEKTAEDWVLSDATAAINKMGYSSMHPCLSKDEKQLYFVSDRPGGQGDFDLYISELTGDRWSIPKNLGRYVNSKANEGFPFEANKDSLYFASDRTGGQGGMDIYLSIKSNGQWSEAKLLPEPLNSSADDFAYFALENRQKGYLSSNREEKDQIYSWSINNSNVKEEIPTEDR